MMTTQTLSVLLVDDDPYVCDIFQLILQHHELPLTTFDNAQQAIQYLQAHSTDIVILDLFLPEMDGYRALDAIRRLPGGRRCKVIATTAYYTQDTGTEVMNRGFDGYLPKPVLPEKLVPYLYRVAGRW
ncbi:MAG: response regulator [Chloroflexi bacterium]|nr:response regulator [Chloroflexota bacterium]